MGVSKNDSEDLPRLWMNSFGVFLALKPDAVNRTWTSGLASWSTESEMYNSFEYNIHGKVRIPTHPAIKDSVFWEDASTRVSNSELYETILMDIEAYKFDLELDPSSNIDELCEIVPDYSKGHILESMSQSIGDAIENEVDWSCLQSALSGSKISGSIKEKSTYLTAYAFLIVDDFHGFYQRVEEELVSKQIFAKTHNYPFAEKIQHGVMELRLKHPVEQVPFTHFPYFGSKAAPVYLWVIRRDDIGKISMPTFLNGPQESPPRTYSVIPDTKKQQEHTLQINRMLVIRNSVAWAENECTRILEALPNELIILTPPTNLHLKERAENYLRSWEQLSVVRSTQLLLRDFVIHEEAISVDTEYHDITLDKDKIEQRLAVLGQRLDNIEKTVQTRLSFDREELHARNQEKFDRIAIALGILVLAEILASYIAWLFPNDDIVGHLVWIILIVGSTVAIVIALKALER